jgi:hypothetical protein
MPFLGGGVQKSLLGQHAAVKKYATFWSKKRLFVAHVHSQILQYFGIKNLAENMLFTHIGRTTIPNIVNCDFLLCFFNRIKTKIFSVIRHR